MRTGRERKRDAGVLRFVTVWPLRLELGFLPGGRLRPRGRSGGGRPCNAQSQLAYGPSPVREDADREGTPAGYGRHVFATISAPRIDFGSLPCGRLRPR